MNSPSEDVKDMITQSAGVGTFGVGVFISVEPPTPDLCVTIYDTGGYPADLAVDIYNPTIQVRVRGAVGGYQAAYQKALAVLTLLHGVHNETWNGTRYILIRAMSDILNVGEDDKGRPILTINFQLMRT